MKRTFVVESLFEESMFLYDRSFDFMICRQFLKYMANLEYVTGKFKVEFSTVRPHQKGWKILNFDFSQLLVFVGRNKQFSTVYCHEHLLEKAGNPTKIWARVTKLN